MENKSTKIFYMNIRKGRIKLKNEEKGEDRSMNNYKRIVSYLYYYGNGDKKNNVGYVRMERKDDICKVTIHMRSINSNDKKLGVYFFYREKEQLIGIFLGNMTIKRGVGEFKKIIEEEIINGLQVTLEEMGGIIIYENNEHFFATQWDDEFINIMNFYMEDNNEQKWKQKQLELGEREKLKAADLIEVEIQEVEKKALTGKEIEREEKISEQEPVIGKEVEDEKQELTSEELEDGSQSLGNRKLTDIEFENKELENVKSKIIEEENKNIEVKEPKHQGLKLGELDNQIKGPNLVETKEVEDNPQIEKQRNWNRGNLNISRINQAINKFSAQTTRRMQNENNQINNHSYQKEIKLNQTKAEQEYQNKQLENRWRQQVREQKRKLESQIEHADKIFAKFPTIDLCNKEVFKKCVKIEPQDIGSFPMETWVLANNSFLLHGYYNYRYLIFAQYFHEGRWEYVIGVPGIYEPRESFMAKMFGFQNFCPTNQKEEKTGAFGYWYQVLHL